MGKTVVLECPECGDRKLVEYDQRLTPTVWCSHLHAENASDPFVKMEEVDD